MKLNIKSKKGFTLIELLVVIGILAVLAAIAIPSVAGLIDRANVSTDNTNANEMTNAMERFVSEYELYKQDIASGAIKDGDGDGVPDNMDAAQGRVYNVTKAVTRADIEKLESLAGFNGIRIDIDNKYAQNHETAKAVMQNYMKTSSSTFEPKQSDMTYWYNTVTGYTVVAEKYTNTEELYKKLPSDVKYSPTIGASVTEWVDLSSDFTIPDIRIMKLSRDKIDDKTAVRFDFTIPNPKYNDIELSKVYIIYGYYTEDAIDITNYVGCHSVSSVADQIQAIDDDVVNIHGRVAVKESAYDKYIGFRTCYEYIENGITRYAYSPVLYTTYNNLPQ